MDQSSKRLRKMDCIRKNDYTKTAEERSENNVRKPQSRPARYVNGVRLSDDQIANITQHTVTESIKKSSKVKNGKKKYEKQQQLLRTSSHKQKDREMIRSRTS